MAMNSDSTNEQCCEDAKCGVTVSITMPAASTKRDTTANNKYGSSSKYNANTIININIPKDSTEVIIRSMPDCCDRRGKVGDHDTTGSTWNNGVGMEENTTITTTTEDQTPTPSYKDHHPRVNLSKNNLNKSYNDVTGIDYNCYYNIINDRNDQILMSQVLSKNAGVVGGTSSVPHHINHSFHPKLLYSSPVIPIPLQIPSMAPNICTDNIINWPPCVQQQDHVGMTPSSLNYPKLIPHTISTIAADLNGGIQGCLSDTLNKSKQLNRSLSDYNPCYNSRSFTSLNSSLFLPGWDSHLQRAWHEIEGNSSGFSNIPVPLPELQSLLPLSASAPPRLLHSQCHDLPFSMESSNNNVTSLPSLNTPILCHQPPPPTFNDDNQLDISNAIINDFNFNELFVGFTSPDGINDTGSLCCSNTNEETPVPLPYEENNIKKCGRSGLEQRDIILNNPSCDMPNGWNNIHNPPLKQPGGRTIVEDNSSKRVRFYGEPAVHLYLSEHSPTVKQPPIMSGNKFSNNYHKSSNNHRFRRRKDIRFILKNYLLSGTQESAIDPYGTVPSYNNYSRSSKTSKTSSVNRSSKGRTTTTTTTTVPPSNNNEIRNSTTGGEGWGVTTTTTTNTCKNNRQSCRQDHITVNPPRTHIAPKYY